MLTRRSNPYGDLRRAAIATAFAIFGALAAGPVLGSGESVPVNAFNVPPGATVTLTFEVNVDNPLNVCGPSVSNQGSVTGNNFTTVSTDDPAVGGGTDPTVTVLDVVALSITKTDGATSEIPGTPITYTITVANAGPASAIGATVTDLFPASIVSPSWTCVASAGSSCTSGPASGNINDTVSLLAGGTLTYTVNATVASGATTLSNTATVTKPAGSTECNLADNSANDTDTLTAQTDLAILKTDGVASVNAGSPTTYTITVTNSGPSDAIGASVSDTFPAAVASASWTCVASAGSTCTAGPVAGNISDTVTVRAGGTLTYTAIANVSGTATGTLVNTATVSAASDTNLANNTSTDTDNIIPQADLSITKTDGVTTAVPGMTVTYTIVAANAGPATATGASVADTFPAACASVSWTCVASGGGSCTAGPVSGNIADSVNLPASASATYTAVCTLANNATGTLSNTATISGGGVVDPTPGNGSATDTDTILPLDFGDAPGTPLGPPWAYPTTLADNGARHGVNGVGALKMGSLIDTETDGQPTATANGDDTTGSDDEDGVTLPTTLITCESANVTVNASAVAKLDAWVDFNRDGDFADAGEKIFNNQNLTAGNNPLAFTVPCGATPTSQTFARFRISTVGGLSFNGVAADGEVEDYPIGIQGLDFGDAPDPAYPTLFASNGARHVLTGSGPVLGIAPDAEANGQQNGTATGDDINGTDDEDGVTFTSPLIPGQNATVTVTASAAGVLNAWVDFNGDGSWSQAGDKIFTNLAVAAGPNLLTFAVPAGASSNTATFSRFRVATASGLSFTGLAADGEVEDHAVSTAPVADLSITKTDGSATEIPGTPVTYTIVASNAGPDPITGATVTDTFPAAITGVNWTCVGAGGGTCTASGSGNLATSVNLPAGGSVTFTATGTIAATATGTLANTATVAVPAAAFDPTSGNNSATDTDTLTPQTDLAITKTDGAASEVPGTPVTYTIVASNAGPSSAVGATVADTFPAAITGINWTCVGAAGGTCPASGSGNIAASVNLPVGGSVTFTATGNIASSASGSLSNTATVAAGAGATDPTPGNNSATDTDTLAAQADLAITKTDGATSEVPGTPITYTITASNSGPSDAVGTAVADTFPGTITGVNWTCVGAGGSTCPASGSGNINSVVTVTAGGSVTFTATGNIASSATGSLSNTATVTAAGGTTDPNPANNSATDTDTLSPQADLEITKDDSADPPPAGQDLVYTITVHNLGPSDAAGVVVTDPLPAAVTYVSDDCSATNTPPWTWNVGNLTNGTTVTCHITVSINPTPPASISNTASVTATTTDPVSGNNSDTEQTQLDAIPPEVSNVNSVNDTGDGSLAECETSNVEISQLLVTFDEAMATTGAGNVTDPASYRVVGPGPDLTFQTTDCSAIGGDDVAVGITGVTYDGPSRTATLQLGGQIPDSQYRFFACATLTDVAGNPLDGDGDDDGGDDFGRAFRVDASNLFANGHFDCDIAGWTPTAATAGEVAWNGANDAGATPDSGSTGLTNLMPGIDTTFGISQCVAVPADSRLTVDARVRLQAAAGVSVNFVRSCEFFSAAGCTGSLGGPSDAFVLQDTAGIWLDLSREVVSPVTAASALCRFRIETPTGASFNAYFDRLVLSAEVEIFSDGFETGDTSQWSQCVGAGCSP